MVVLDYVIRNTDRGPANWLIKFGAGMRSKNQLKSRERIRQEGDQKQSEENGNANAMTDREEEEEKDDQNLMTISSTQEELSDEGYRTSKEENVNNNEKLDKSDVSSSSSAEELINLDKWGNENDNAEEHTRRIFIAAIDNGLAFPFKHPDDWRGYPFHWAGYSFAKIPFNEQLRQDLVPKLTDMTSVESLVENLRALFALDRDFNIQKFEHQMGVMRGQILNLVQALKEGKSPADLVQMEYFSVERRHHGRPSMSQGSLLPGHSLPSADVSPSGHHKKNRQSQLTHQYSFIDQKKKPKCGCCW